MSTKGSCSGNKKPVVMTYYTYSDRIGGPLTYIHTLLDSDLQEQYEMVTLFQEKAPGGLDLGLLREMKRKIRAVKPDIVHVQGAQSEGFYGVLAAKLAGCKHVVMAVHGFAFDDSCCQGLKRFLYRHMVEPLSLWLADGVYCVCEHAAKRSIVQKSVRSKKRLLGCIHNCVPDLKVTVPREQMRRSLGLKETDVVFGVCGRVTKDKGFELIEGMMPMIDAKYRDSLKLMIIGDGEYRQTFQQNMAQEIADGRILMIGQTNSVADYLQACDGYLFPSYHENLSIALLEAGASGLACVVSDVGGNSEIIRDGKTGIVVQEQKPEAYAHAVNYLLEHPDVMGMFQKAVKEDVSTRFAKETMIERVRAVYDCCKK